MALNERTSSRDSACLNVRIALLVETKGRLFVMTIPTLATVSLQRQSLGQVLEFSAHTTEEQYTHQTPTNSICTSLQNVCLNPAARASLLTSVLL